MAAVSLSICVITKNEGKFLRTCLLSVYKIADEIIIVDSGSGDDTLSIAADFNAKIFSITWRDDYAWARNQAISKCSGDWILFLDADEYLENPEKLLKVIAKEKRKDTGGFLMERTDVYRHTDNGLILHYPVGIVRLFRNYTSLQYTGAVHEQVNTAITDAGFNIEVLKATRIIHQVHMYADDFLAVKQRRYLALIEKELAKGSNNHWMKYQQAKTYWFLGEKEKAKSIFAEIANNPQCPFVIRCSCFCNRGVLLMEEGSLAQALDEVNKSLALNPQQSMGMMIRGNIFYAADKFKESIRCYRKVKTSINKLRYQQIIPGDLYVKPEEIKYKIACCYMAMGKTAAAKFLLKRALNINGSHAPSLLLLARMYAANNKTVIAKSLAAQCLLVNPGWKQAEEFVTKLNAIDNNTNHSF